MRLSEKPLTPWIIAKDNGQIVTAHCNCVAGLGETCSHVASVLWAIESGVRLRESLTVTQKKAYWVIPTSVKEVPYARVRDIDFIGKRKSRKLLLNSSFVKSGSSLPSASSSLSSSSTLHSTSSTQRFTFPTLSPAAKQSSCSSGLSSTSSPIASQAAGPSAVEVNQFFAALAHTSSKPAILSLVEPYSSSYIPKPLDEDLPVCLSELQKPEYLKYSYGELLKVAEQFTLAITPIQAHTVESKTRLQSKSSLWFRMRCGRITASKFKSAAHTDPASPSLSLIMSICYPELTRFKTVATTWGCEHEKTALSEYYNIHASKCKDKHLKVFLSLIILTVPLCILFGSRSKIVVSSLT